MPKLGQPHGSTIASRIVDVGSENRVTIPAEVAACAPWIPECKKGGESLECIAIVGKAGGLQIAPLDHPLAKLGARIENSIDAQAESQPEELMRLARLYATTWTVLLHADSANRRLIIPTAVIDLGLLGEAPLRQVVIFCAGQLEIWGVDAWRRVQQETAANIENAEKLAQRHLVGDRKRRANPKRS